MHSQSSSRFVSLLASLALCVACNSQPAEGAAGAAPLAAAVQARAALVTPTLGGSVVAIGEQQLELAVLENGGVIGQLYDARGAAVAAAELPEVSVDLRMQGGGRAHAELSWRPALGCLAGRAQLTAGLVAEPLDVSLDSGGQRSTAALSGYAILPFARFGGVVIAVGPHAVELVAQGNAVLAHVLQASGQARAGADLSLQLAVAGAAPLALTWDPQRVHYRAQLDGQLELAAQPLRLTLVQAGKSYLGAVSSLSAAARAHAAARAQLSVAGAVQADAPGLGARAGAALPGAELKAAASAGAAQLAAGKLAVSKGVSARASAPAVSLKVSKSASASSSVKKPSAKASAGVKAGASFSLGK